jgi:endonuclease I
MTKLSFLEGIMATKVEKKIRKFKKSKEYRTIIGVLVLLIAAIGYFFYTDGTNDIVYSSSQNEDGYYYYVEETDMSNYYYSANQLSGVQLQNKLSDIISANFQAVSYKDAKTYLSDADASLEDDSKIWKIYDGELTDSAWDAGTTWNREHVWPNSRLGIERVNDSGKNQASDLHNLRAATPRVNSSRGDRFYTDGSGEYTTNEDGGYYPGDEHIGDVARILFYMVTMYDYLELTNDLEDLLDESDHNTMDGARMGVLDLLLEWHKLDPVDDFERQRNAVIYDVQGNRNPYIDHPEYVHLIWENKSISDITKPVEVDPNLQDTRYIAVIEKKYI